MHDFPWAGLSILALIAGGLLLLAYWEDMGWDKPPPAPKGICRSCGYDLRATPDKCPECGRETEA